MRGFTRGLLRGLMPSEAVESDLMFVGGSGEDANDNGGGDGVSFGGTKDDWIVLEQYRW